ncbi:Testicular haploid expressed gene protein-like, partial [Geodia barretti]
TAIKPRGTPRSVYFISSRRERAACCCCVRPAVEMTREKATERLNRFAQLSTPKESKADWWTSFGPKLQWGNQESMWPVSRAALTSTPSARLTQLAQCKQDHRRPDTLIPEYQFSCGRMSTLWDVSEAALSALCSERVSFLARHKTAVSGYLRHREQFVYSCGRCSPIWRVRQDAIICPQRPRTASLAQSKRTHRLYIPAREVQTVVSRAAKGCTASEHTERLAKAKEKAEGPFREPQSQVSEAAKRARPTDRILDLARPKKVAEGYQPCRDVEWKVSNGAKNAVASNR